MARQYDDYQIAEKDATDILRTVVRLKYRIAQRHELNEREKPFVDALVDAATEGRSFDIYVPALIGEVLDEAPA